MNVFGLLEAIVAVSNVFTVAPQAVLPLGPEVRLLKKSVLVNEPVFAQVLHPNISTDWKSRISNDPYSLAWFEVRRGERGKWIACKDLGRAAYQTFSAVVAVPQRLDVDRLRVAFLNGCGFDGVGRYWVRWGGGPPTLLKILPIPPQEQAGSTLMSGVAVTASLATSVYAGYALVRPLPPSRPLGPAIQAESRLRLAQAARSGAEDVRYEMAVILKKQIEAHEARASLLIAQLGAHPEFVFSDNVRLSLAGVLTFLGRCREASEQLSKVRVGDWVEVAKEFSNELQQVQAGPNTVCEQRQD